MARPPRAVLALDIGGTKLAVGVVTPDGATQSFLVEPTHKEEGHAVVIRRLFDLGHRALEAAGIDEIAAVGISCGGPLDAEAGVLVAPLHLPGWIDIPLVAMTSAEFGVPAVLENDASAAALGEYRYGIAQHVSTLLYLTVSTGIGGGAVLGGKLHRGAAGNGGEYGHIMVRPGGRPCLCGRNGCLEGYASGSSIALRAREAVQATDRQTSLRELDVILAEDVAAAAREGDELASEIWSETTDVLAQAVTDLVNVFEPDVVVLGGGVTRSGEQLLGPVRTAVLRDAMRPAAAAVRIESAGLGDAVGVVGAAALAFDLAESRVDA
ncbi:MAG TPA: ROK family protein [Galbitalea sp.]|jgi:glucokinase|nr:ROK family protein [Galbitalea sp.]